VEAFLKHQELVREYLRINGYDIGGTDAQADAARGGDPDREEDRERGIGPGNHYTRRFTDADIFCETIPYKIRGT